MLKFQNPPQTSSVADSTYWPLFRSAVSVINLIVLWSFFHNCFGQNEKRGSEEIFLGHASVYSNFTIGGSMYISGLSG